MALTLVMLAAGIGSRYGGLKQMDPVGPSGEFILDYSVYDALRAGFDRVVFVIRRDIEEAFRAAMGARIGRQVAADYVMQELSDLPAGCAAPAQPRAKPWGTGHAIWVCRNAVDGPFAAINADDFYGAEAYRALAAFLRDTAGDPAAYSMVGYVLRNTLSEHGAVARGICQADGRGFLQTVVERTKIEKTASGVLCPDQPLTGDEWVSMNIWGFKPSIFGHIEKRFPAFLEAAAANPKAELYIPTIVDELIREGSASVRVLQTRSPWFGVTYPQDKPAVVQRIRDLVKAGAYPPSLWTRG